MKSVTIVAKDNNYSLQNAENYKNESEFDFTIYMLFVDFKGRGKYVNLLNRRFLLQ